MNHSHTDRLEELSREARKWIVRMIAAAGDGHIGGSLSCVEILVTLYFGHLRIDFERPSWRERDRLLLSKGHAGPALYSVLALRGYFSVDELCTLDRPKTRLTKHIDRRKLPFCEMSAGMLGQGLSIGVGMALGARLGDRPCRVYVILGDGELQSGQVWEAVMCAAKYQLDNLVAVVDRNSLQVDGATERIMPLEPLAPKWRGFGWHVIEVNGHDPKELLGAYESARLRKGQPTAIIAKTVKGRGVSFMEGQVGWHSRAITTEQAEVALADLEE